MNTISFPKMFNKNNYSMCTSLSYDIESINESLKAIFSINKGELLGDPNYGSNISELLFNIKNLSNINELKTSIVDIINKFVPRIDTNINNITIYSNPNNNKYKITIKYKVIPNSTYGYFETII